MAEIFFIGKIFDPSTAYAQNCSAIQRPGVKEGKGITSNMGPRNLNNTKCGRSKPCPKCSTMHRGTDVSSPCGSKVAVEKCCKFIGTGTRGGYGHVANFDCGNGVKMQYAHLDARKYDAASHSVITGSTGVGTACHLDVVMTIDGKTVDVQCATTSPAGDSAYKYGCSSTKHGIECPPCKDLSSAECRQKLQEHGEKVLKGNSSYNVGGGSTASDPKDGEEQTDDPAAQPAQPQPLPEDPPGEDPTPEPRPDPEDDKKDPKNPESPYNPKASKPICDNSTCITKDHIENAKHKRVIYDKKKTHQDFTKPPEGDCKGPHETGVEIFITGSKKKEPYKDAFCTNQGCTYINEKEEGLGECKLP